MKNTHKENVFFQKCGGKREQSPHNWNGQHQKY